MDGKVGAVVFILLVQADAHQLLDDAIDQATAHQGDNDGQAGHEQLGQEGHATGATQGLQPEDAGGDAAPGAAQAVQGPDAEHVVDLPAVLGQGEHDHEKGTGNTAGDQGTKGVHQVGAGADGHQAGQGAVMHEARVVLAQHQGRQGAAHHGHEGVEGHQAGNLVQALGAHDVEAEPADDEDPGAQGQEGNGGRRMGAGDAAILVVAAAAGAEQEHGGQGDPAAHGMHHHGAGKIVELLTKAGLQPGLHTEVLVPGDALEEGVDETDEHEGCDQLRMESRALGDAAGDDGRDGGGEGEQEEEFGQLETVLRHQRLDAREEIDAVGDAVADKEVGNGRYPEVAQDLDQGIDLVLLAHGADFEESEACVHGQHHDGAEQNEQHIAAGL